MHAVSSIKSIQSTQFEQLTRISQCLFFMIRTAANCRDMMSAWSWPRRGHHSLLDIGGWILLGSCLALVAILAAATYHYR